MERNRKSTIDLIIKLVIIVIIILLLIHNCVLIKNKNCNKEPDIIDIDCKDEKCNAILKTLTISPVNIDFKSNKYNYDLVVDANTEELVINAMPFEPSTKVEIPSDLSLKEGLNVFKIVAIAKDGRKKIYTINVTKNPSDNKIIKNIKVSPKNIDFKEDKYTYNINVSKDVNEIGIEVIPFDSETKVKVPSDLSLKEGQNTFKIKVTTKDGKEVTYTINVNREKKNTKTAILKELTTSPKNIDFKEDVYVYDIEVDANVKELIINALPFDSGTKVIIPKDLILKEGLNTFVVEATTKDGKTVKYTINVNKKGADKKVIKDITVGPKDIGFKEDVYTYNIEVENDITEISLSVLPFDKNTTVTITPSDLTLKEGLNTFKVEATNKDGITKLYTINVNKKGDTKVIKDITVGPEDIDFKEDVYIYDIEVEDDVTEITLNVEVYNTSTTVIIPNDLSLEVGLNTFKVEATNKSGVKKVYTINVTRKTPEFGFIVKDKNVQWSEGTSVEIFENPLYDIGKIIAPESSNTYRFEVKNSTNYTLKYEIEFTETNIHNINMKYKLRKNDTYLIDQYVSASELNVADLVLQPSKKDTYYLEWKWISSSNDTEIGKTNNASYSLKIDIKAENIDG